MTSESLTPWYERYFGADYLRIYRLADTEEQLAFLRTVLAPYRGGGWVLDLPCGHGRHCLTLASEGWRLVGLDLSPTFLAVAGRRAAELALPGRLARADMRFVPLADGACAAAICMFTSLGYFDRDAEHQQVLDEFGRVVAAGGRLVLDLANINAVRRQPPGAEWRKDGVQVVSRYLWHEDRRRAETRRTVTFADGRVEHYQSSVRLFEADEIEAMLAAAGFAIETVYGSYRAEPLTETQPRRLLVAVRSAS
jgi:SAM-dependent methyltransferase